MPLLLEFKVEVSAIAVSKQKASFLQQKVSF